MQPNGEKRLLHEDKQEEGFMVCNWIKNAGLDNFDCLDRGSVFRPYITHPLQTLFTQGFLYTQHILLQRAQVQFLVCKPDDTQLPVTPVPKELISSFGLCCLL